jgi:hypothetical protein
MRLDAALVFVLALLPRLAHFLYVRATPLAGGYVPDLPAYLQAVSQIMNSVYLFRAPMLMNPGYPLVLAPQYILAGPDVPLFVAVNAVLDAGSAALCAMLAARVAGPGRARVAGLAAGLLYAVCGPLMFYAMLPLGEGPAVFCLLAGLALLFDSAGRSDQKRGGARPWLAGALLALAALIRPNLFPAEALALAAWTLGGAGLRPRLSAAWRAAVVMLVVFAPFMAHNLAREGRATPFGFQGGVTLAAGNHPGASGGSDAIAGVGAVSGLASLDAVFEAERRLGRPLGLAQADAYWYGEARRFFFSQPGEAARVLGRKALRLVNNSGLDATMDMDFCARFSPVPGLLALPAGLVLALAAGGLVVALRRGRRTSEGLAVCALCAGIAALLVLFQVTPRYRAPLLAPALCLAGVLLAALPEMLRRPSRLGGLSGQRAGRSGLAGPLGVFLAVLALSLIPLRSFVPAAGPEALRERLAREHVRLARYYLSEGPARLAVPEYEAALALGGPDKKALEAGLVSARALSAHSVP